LQQLFNNLPRRCIVLLEDTDTAGLVREEKSDDSEPENVYGKTSPNGGNGRCTGTGLSTIESEATSNGISLSGLLNAIDGVASHEGRVLIMTSNFPEKLDSALIRPGRVDMQVAFTLATKLQIKEIFIKMYASDPNRLNSANEDNPNTTHPTPKYKAIATKRIFSKEELQPLADKFVNSLPEGKFSPAEVQNFLITRKKDPYKALDEICAWRDQLLKSREKKSRAVTTT
jgi:chaperone BCS1